MEKPKVRLFVDQPLGAGQAVALGAEAALRRAVGHHGAGHVDDADLAQGRMAVECRAGVLVARELQRLEDAVLEDLAVDLDGERLLGRAQRQQERPRLARGDDVRRSSLGDLAGGRVAHLEGDLERAGRVVDVVGDDPAPLDRVLRDRGLVALGVVDRHVDDVAVDLEHGATRSRLPPGESARPTAA